MEDCRKQFEAEFNALDHTLDEWGSYKCQRTNIAWAAWQAAYTRPVPAGLVEKLEAARDSVQAYNPELAGAQRIAFNKAIALVKAHAQPVSLKAISAKLAPIHNRDDAIVAVLDAAGVAYGD